MDLKLGRFRGAFRLHQFGAGIADATNLELDDAKHGKLSYASLKLTRESTAGSHSGKREIIPSKNTHTHTHTPLKWKILWGSETYSPSAVLVHPELLATKPSERGELKRKVWDLRL